VGDNSGEYISLNDEFVHRFSENLGFGSAVNHCARLIDVKYLAIINPDTEFECDICSACLNAYHPGVGIISALQKSPITKKIQPSYGAFPNIWHSLFLLLPFDLVPRRAKELFWPLIEISGLVSNKSVKSIYGSFMFISSDLFCAFNCFDTRFFMYYEETDLCKRLFDKGYENLVLNDQHTYFHDSGYSVNRSVYALNKLMIKSRYSYMRKHFGISIAELDRLILFFTNWKRIFTICKKFNRILC
jgi:N-acetylglucosaminyl-diphospho-decaprenol L-rhamnosyltransferase